MQNAGIDYRESRKKDPKVMQAIGRALRKRDNEEKTAIIIFGSKDLAKKYSYEKITKDKKVADVV
jgi:dihydrofolate reductase